MPTEGGWTVNGRPVAELAASLKAADHQQYLNMRAAFRVATAPATAAVRAKLIEIMPKSGGLNEWLAAAPIRTSTLTGPRTAGVRLVAKKLTRADKGFVRHPVFGNRDVWRPTTLPSGWWESTLGEFRAPVTAALLKAAELTAHEAMLGASGF